MLSFAPINIRIMKRILIAGGYGNAGRCIAQYLLKAAPQVQVILAGRQEDKARAEAETLDRDFPGRVTGCRIDLADPVILDEVFSKIDFVVNAAGAVPHTRNVAEALLRHRKSALDTQLSSPEKTRVLEEFAPRFEAAGITYITDGGFHPGVPAAMLRFAATRVDSLEKGNIYSALKIDWGKLQFSSDTAPELIDEFRSNRLALYQNGVWKDQSAWKVFSFDFGPPFGKQYCAPMFLPEMEDLTRQMPSLSETGFLVTGFNPVTDYLILPFLMLGIQILPRSWDPFLAKLLVWGFKFSRPPFGIEMVAECAGRKDGKAVHIRVKLAHEDGYVMTAIPVVACLLQFLDGSIAGPGLVRQALAVEPIRFMKDLEKMGILVTSH